ncbi:MAG: hypothetical protein D6816_17845 [Bacteroidetes bacterium]|nr:MAG: hypothetical protein D6816_17845 [Bacteroidota bacterium]
MKAHVFRHVIPVEKAKQRLFWMVWMCMKRGEEERMIRKAFVIRLWRNAENFLGWRGEVQNVQTGETTYIRSAGELLDYLQQQMQSSENDTPMSSTPGLH